MSLNRTGGQAPGLLARALRDHLRAETLVAEAEAAARALCGRLGAHGAFGAERRRQGVEALARGELETGQALLDAAIHHEATSRAYRQLLREAERRCGELRAVEQARLRDVGRLLERERACADLPRRAGR